MIDFFEWFFSADGFMPHGHCYLWQPAVLWLHILSDALITLAYFSIPFTLVYFVRKRKDLEFTWMFVCFAVFIIACGTTHLMEVIVIWRPYYWLSGVIKAITAAASIPTAILLVKLVPKALRLPSPSALRQINTALQTEIAERKRAEDDVRRLNDELEQRVRERTAELEGANRALKLEIDERKRMEQALRESESRFRQIAESLPQLVWTCQPDGLCDFLSQQWVEFTGVPVEDQLGSGWLSQIHPDDHTHLMDSWDAAVASRSRLQVEFRIRRNDGVYRWFDTRAEPLKDSTGRIVKWFGSNTDITERKQSEQKLRTQLARLDLLSRTTRAIGERQDLRSIFQVVIRSLEEHLPIDFGCICTYDAVDESLTVTSVGVKSQPLALDLAMSDQARIGIDRNGLSRCVHGHLVYEPDISEIQFPFPQRLARGGLRALVIAPLIAESNVFGVLIAARLEPRSFGSSDCEFLRQLSEHVGLASHQSQLYSALQEAYDELRQTQQAVMQQERLRALGQMASGIAHDINNAISPVSLYAESLLEREPNLSERARNYLQTIRDAIDGVASTIARMREFYRQREPELELVSVNLNRLVEKVVELTRARWSDIPQQRGIVIKLVTELTENLPMPLGVESEIREALTNLVFNAVDAMPDGGTLTLRTKTSASDATQRVQLEVADTGVGMDETTRRRCLEPFFTTKGEHGTGLGLAMVYGTVKRHGAEIGIESRVGKGTVVCLSFSAPTVLGAETSQPAVTRARPPRLRILLVDDDPLLLKSLRDTLEEDGHVVLVANSGEQGIEIVRASQERNEPFSVVITDLGMPYVDGRRVASAVKGIAPSTPVILLTGWGQRLVEEREVPPHVDLVLNKPPVLQKLRDALIHCCRKASEGD